MPTKNRTSDNTEKRKAERERRPKTSERSTNKQEVGAACAAVSVGWDVPRPTIGLGVRGTTQAPET